MNKNDLITMRDRLDSDMSFIYQSWLRGLRYSNDWFNTINHDAYYANYTKIVQNLLAQKETQVRVACLIEDPDVIIGYSVTRPEKQAIDWVFVKPHWRKLGIAKDLIPKGLKWSTHITLPGNALRKKLGLDFNPFL
jgi:GNAT superfamily N-acetyltransferase